MTFNILTMGTSRHDVFPGSNLVIVYKLEKSRAMRHKHPKARTSATERKLDARVKPDLVMPVESMASKYQESRRPVGGCNVHGAVGELPRVEDLSVKSEKPEGFGQMPLELLMEIFSYVSHFSSSQLALCACTYVSRSWYLASARFLYRSPYISGRNFDQFVRTICPSVNAHIRTNGLSELVRVLDMSRLVHNGSRSLTARILGRLKGGLEDFIAPQASFASVPQMSSLLRYLADVLSVNCLAALSRCHNLVHLDLSLVSESLAMNDLFHSISALDNLETFRFPRSSSSDRGTTALFNSWPPKLQKLQIAGGIRDQSLLYFSTLPNTLTSLVIGDCPNLSMAFLKPLLAVVGSHVQILKIDSSLPQLTWYSLNTILEVLPALRHFNVAADYICEDFFRQDYGNNLDNPRFLESMEITCLHTPPIGQTHDITSDLIYNAVVDGPLKNLRRLSVRQMLGWIQDEEGRKSVEELSELLQALAREDLGPNASDEEVNAGVWIFL